MTRAQQKEALRVAATAIIKQSPKFNGEAYYLRKALRNEHGQHLSSVTLRIWMQELADAGHFIRSEHPHGGQGYTWSLPA